MFKKKRPKEKSILFGRQPLLEALNNNIPLEKILIRRNLKGEVIHQIMVKARELHIPIQIVPVEKLNWYTTKNHQGVLARLSVIPFANLEDILSNVYDKGDMPLFLLLDQVSDVRNFGAIARTALCMGVQAIVVSAKGSAAINDEALKTSAGALLQLPICRTPNLANSLSYLQDNGLTVLATDLKAEKMVNELELNIPLAILMGSEGAGLQKNLLAKANITTRIPMANAFDSLNVSVATGMMLYEVLRQRGEVK